MSFWKTVKARRNTLIPVGAGLARDDGLNANPVLNVKPLSQASQLPQRAWLPALLQQTCLFLQKRRTPTGVQVLTA